mmetsp:Transcript_44518/g.79983  ORF Transcript_44518/g.79983 Transcript_44518/m.79983 type:complete len:324 (+) Transcript_44518:67-1038(+)|eukprot:CAMPEP_0197665184 /NCGR_PEP_ID=MMETSP1338-20131121/59079_1 /TAXON_ID=43686 ORGANISM="Pelagodinium beii, Strain RCC1491" /NCGR_SAMPLE_ID=MMETSP1338 /ASSEMBLY_ACC=CAM_ASM_000754 /LENGTH=323 /DNA_ID=CAMNT_0043243953 /DNA_START=67 /DNA_END=1038 /DNA_ORIENTATION=+
MRTPSVVAAVILLAAAEAVDLASSQSYKLRKARLTTQEGADTKSTSNLVSVLQDLRSAWAHQTPLLQLSRAVSIEHQLVDQQDTVVRVSKDDKSREAATKEAARSRDLLNSTSSNLESSRQDALKLADEARAQATTLWAEAKAQEAAQREIISAAEATLAKEKKKKAKMEVLSAEAHSEVNFFSSGAALTEEEKENLASISLPVHGDPADWQEDVDSVGLVEEEVNSTAATNSTEVANATGGGNETDSGNATEAGNATEVQNGAEAESDEGANNATEASNASDTAAAPEGTKANEAVNVTESDHSSDEAADSKPPVSKDMTED